MTAHMLCMTTRSFAEDRTSNWSTAQNSLQFHKIFWLPHNLKVIEISDVILLLGAKVIKAT